MPESGASGIHQRLRADCRGRQDEEADQPAPRMSNPIIRSLYFVLVLNQHLVYNIADSGCQVLAPEIRCGSALPGWVASNLI